MRYKIALSGKAGSGKDTTVKYFLKYLPKETFNMIAFADPIKEIILKMFPECDEKCLYGTSDLRYNVIDNSLKDTDENFLTYRRILMDLGKLGRRYNDNTWINALNFKLKNTLYDESVIISDLRFINEYYFLKEKDFTLIRIKREDILKSKDISEVQQDELSDGKFDFILDNNSTLENLESKVKDIVANIKV